MPGLHSSISEELSRSTAFWLGEESPLAGHLPGFKPRQGQAEMALAAAEAFGGGTPLVVEAGTGTGKTLAYLAPAVLSGLKVVVSTGTRTLQDQIAQKELPLLKSAMHAGLRWAVLKGRTNYLCLRKYMRFSAQPDLGLENAESGLAALSGWLEGSKDGDLDHVRGKGLSAGLLAEVSSTSEQCLGARCPKREDCFLMEARRKAAEADIVVVNHHLFLADLKLKSAGHGEALPRYQAVVFDEAHLLPEIATQAFGVSVSERRLKTLARDVLQEAPRVAEQIRAVNQAGSGFFAALHKLAGPGGTASATRDDLESLALLAAPLGKALDKLAHGLGDNEEEEALSQRADTYALDLKSVAKPIPGETVAWVESRRGMSALNLSPVEVGPHLEAALYCELGRLVFTSATLAPGKDLDPMRRRLGLPDDTNRLVVESPFNPREQALLYVPRDMPLPQSKDFSRAVAREVELLLSHSRGRAFVLFTSHRNLREVSSLLEGKLGYPVFIQGQAPRMKLLKRFVEQSPSVLFATASFWQGVDVPGEALSAVIVDKLPFAPPDDPLVAARMEKLEADGKSGFAHLMVPEAILSLRQGLGRLLRTPDDRGLLAVLDVRLYSKSYGRRFLKALAPVPVTREQSRVAEFFAE